LIDPEMADSVGAEHQIVDGGSRQKEGAQKDHGIDHDQEIEHVQSAVFAAAGA